MSKLLFIGILIFDCLLSKKDSVGRYCESSHCQSCVGSFAWPATSALLLEYYCPFFCQAIADFCGHAGQLPREREIRNVESGYVLNVTWIHQSWNRGCHKQRVGNPLFPKSQPPHQYTIPRKLPNPKNCLNMLQIKQKASTPIWHCSSQRTLHGSSTCKSRAVCGSWWWSCDNQKGSLVKWPSLIQSVLSSLPDSSI